MSVFLVNLMYSARGQSCLECVSFVPGGRHPLMAVLYALSAGGARMLLRLSHAAQWERVCRLCSLHA